MSRGRGSFPIRGRGCRLRLLRRGSRRHVSVRRARLRHSRRLLRRDRRLLPRRLPRWCLGRFGRRIRGRGSSRGGRLHFPLLGGHTASGAAPRRLQLNEGVTCTCGGAGREGAGGAACREYPGPRTPALVTRNDKALRLPAHKARRYAHKIPKLGCGVPRSCVGPFRRPSRGSRRHRRGERGWELLRLGVTRASVVPCGDIHLARAPGFPNRFVLSARHRPNAAQIRRGTI